MNVADDGLDIEFHQLTYNVYLGFRKGTKKILHGINGKFSKGNLIGIMGPSGSGKTTLLNILSGYITATSGNILVNGKLDKKILKYSSSYITQDSNLQTLLTVDENMAITFELKLGNELSDELKRQRIDEILKILGLTHVSTNRASILSSGEKKRLSIALELINNPAVMFLDEPTTGLDSLASNKCIHHLKSLANQGKTIICTIHQPSATLYEMFDSIYVMNEGKCLYHGNCANLLTILNEKGFPCPVFHNPADFVLDVANGDYGNDIIDNMMKQFNNGISINYQDNGKPILNYHKNNVSNKYKLAILLKREFIKLIRNPILAYNRLIASIIDSLMLGVVFWKVGSDGAKILFSYNAILIFTMHFMVPQLMMAAITFPFEIKSLKSEYFNRWYSLKTYYLAITLIDLPISMMYCMISNCIFYYLTDQPQEWDRFWMFSLAGFFICIIGQSMGLLTGAVCDDIIVGTFVGSAMIAPVVLFSGIAVPIRDLPSALKWVPYFDFLCYGGEGMIGAVIGYDREKLPCNKEYCHWRYPKKFLDDMGIQGENYWPDIFVLVCIFLFLRVVTYFALKGKVKNFK